MKKILALVALCGLLTACVGASAANTVTVTSGGSGVSSGTASKQKTSPTPQMTTSQKMAVESAKQYRQVQAFSKYGLTKQLSAKYGAAFSNKDAVFAVNHIQVNW